MKELGVVGMVVLVVGLLALVFLAIPALFIWCVNTLFHTGIDYSFWNMLAALLLVLLVNGSGSSKKSK